MISKSPCLPMSSLLFFAAFALSAFALPAFAVPAFAEPALKETVPTVTVTGHAETEIVPDLAVLSLAVSTERPTAGVAAADNADAARALIGELKAQGIDAKDIKTAAVTLTAVYDEHYDPNGRVTKRTLRGYRARNGLTIRVHAVDTAGALASRLIDTGANEFQGISFESDQKQAAYDKLRGEAMKDALRQARAYVMPVGLHLGRVLEIAPVGAASPPMYRMAAASYEPAPPANIPVEPGTLTLETQVQVVWEVIP
jgi:uncharacterized protein